METACKVEYFLGFVRTMSSLAFGFTNPSVHSNCHSVG